MFSPPTPTPQDCPFFVDKLKIRTLPCVVLFVGGVAVDRVVGFEPLGGADDFPTAAVRWGCYCHCVLQLGLAAADSRGITAAAAGVHAAPVPCRRCQPAAACLQPQLAAVASAALCLWHTPATLRTALASASPCPQLEKKLLAAGVVEPPPAPRADSDDEGAAARARTMRAGLRQQQRTASDEDSDFD